MAAVPVYVLVPLPDTVHQGFYQVIATRALLIGLLGLKRHRPSRRRGWVLVLPGYAVWVGGDLMWSIEAHVLPDRYPAPSDSLDPSAYLLLGAGTLIFIRAGRALAPLAGDPEQVGIQQCGGSRHTTRTGSHHDHRDSPIRSFHRDRSI